MAFVTKEYPVAYKLPAQLATEIGRAITRYAFLEYQLSLIIYVLLRIGKAEGRLAIREPRATDRLELISDLCKIMNIKPRTDISLLTQSVGAAQNQRNLLAHGIWVKDGQKLLLRDTGVQGSKWKPDQKTSVKKKINPRGVNYTVESARSLVRLIDECCETIEELGQEIDSILYPPKK